MEEARHLRNKLILWRFRNYYRIKEKAATLEDKDIASKVYDGADNISSRVKQVILPLWLIAGDSMKQTLTNMAQTIDNRLKIEDPEYLLELQARDAIKTIVDALDEKEDAMNIGNEVNILYEGPNVFYQIPLSIISRKVLSQRGMKEEEITVSDITSTSKKLKNVFETNLGFNIHIGKKRRRVVIFPVSWIKKEERPPTALMDFLDAEGSYKDVHHVANVHQKDDLGA